jgi:hypothetical protein
MFQQNSNDRERMAEENRALKEILQAHGIQHDFNTSSSIPFSHTDSQFGGSSTSITGSQTRGTMSTGVTSPAHSGPLSIPNQSVIGSPPTSDPNSFKGSVAHYQPTRQQGVDFDQVGIDFVLQYERTPYLSPPPQQ